MPSITNSGSSLPRKELLADLHPRYPGQHLDERQRTIGGLLVALHRRDVAGGLVPLDLAVADLDGVVVGCGAGISGRGTAAGGEERDSQGA
jgi:hypothetical protein